MEVGMWSEPFETIVRAQIGMGPEEELAVDEVLADRGLDSMGTVTLLVELEEAYGIVFPDEALMPDTFATPRALWAMVSRLTASAGKVGAPGV